MSPRKYQTLAISSRRLEYELDIHFPHQFRTSPRKISPTTSIIELEAGYQTAPTTCDDALLVREIPEWILTSAPMSRAHVHLISCLTLPIKQAMYPATEAGPNTFFINPWTTSTVSLGSLVNSRSRSRPTTSSSSISCSPTTHTHLPRNESLSYVEQLRCWHTSTLDRKTRKRMDDHILEPGPTLIRSVYVRILLQMTMDSTGSYYVEHDLEMLNLDVKPRQSSEGGCVSASSLELVKFDSQDGLLSGSDAGDEYRASKRGFLGLLRRHTAS